MNITTDNVVREFVRSWDLTDAERAEFDYHDWDRVEQGFDDDPIFVRYRGQLLDLDEFISPNYHLKKEFPEWDGYLCDTYFSAGKVDYFSGLVMRFTDDNDGVVIGRYSC